MFHKKEKKVEFSIPVCEYCYNERKSKFNIFQLKKNRERNKLPCAVCNAETNWVFYGLADSDKEVELMKEKIIS